MLQKTKICQIYILRFPRVTCVYSQLYLLIFWNSSSMFTAFLALVSMKMAAIDSAKSFASLVGTSLKNTESVSK